MQDNSTACKTRDWFGPKIHVINVLQVTMRNHVTAHDIQLEKVYGGRLAGVTCLESAGQARAGRGRAGRGGAGRGGAGQGSWWEGMVGSGVKAKAALRLTRTEQVEEDGEVGVG